MKNSLQEQRIPKQFYLSPQEKALLLEACQLLSVSLSSFLRMSSLEKARLTIINLKNSQEDPL